MTKRTDLGPPIELSFRLNEDDFLALSTRARSAWLNLPGSVVFQGSRFLMAFVPILASLRWILDDSESWTGQRGVIVAGAAITALVIFAFYPRYLRYRLRRSAGALNSSKHLNVHLTAENQVIRMECGEDNSTVSWKSIERGEETPAHILLFLARMKAVVVPKRAFADEKDLGRFREMVLARVKNFTAVGQS